MSRSALPPDSQLLRAFREAVRAKIARDLEAERAQAAERRSRVLPLIARGLQDARGRGLCGAAWLFGSYAAGEPSERSDVDLLVEGCSDPTLLAAVVGRQTGTDVHVIDMAEAPASLRERVLAEGLPL